MKKKTKINMLLTRLYCGILTILFILSLNKIYDLEMDANRRLEILEVQALKKTDLRFNLELILDILEKEEELKTGLKMADKEDYDKLPKSEEKKTGLVPVEVDDFNYLMERESAEGLGGLIPKLKNPPLYKPKSINGEVK